ncbi:MAG TPA: ATP-binding cassette domain-containing protein [Actinomycetota bacterium]
MDVVRLRDAEVRIGGRRILGPVSLSIGIGERWVVLGPNGSGKTTMLRLAGALRQPSAGTVEVLGERLGATDVRALRARIGFVGHAVADELPPGLSVGDAVLTGKRSTLVTWLQEFDDADIGWAATLLERAGCAHLAAQPFARCSQGERQRVLLARALFGRPELLLLDEPAAGLDLPGREALLHALEAADDLGSTPSVLVTHHLEEIPPTTTHAALLRDGEVMAQGPVEDVLLDEPVSACFGLPVAVSRPGSRWSAASAGRPTVHLT